MSIRLFLFASLLITVTASAQYRLVKEHVFGPVPEVSASVKASDPSSVLLRRTVIMDMEEEGNEVVEYHLLHHSIFLRDVSAIESENKIYVSLNNAIDVVNVSARSIAPDGSIHELTADDFKRATDDKERGSYLYFAFEGLVPGSVVDYFYTLKQRPDLRGDGEILQVGVPIGKEDIHLIAPIRLVYKAKGYQGAPEAINDTSDASVQHLRWELSDVPALEKEESANMGAARMRISYKLDRIPDRGIKDFSGYLGATKLYHGIIHQQIENKQKKELAALEKKMDIPKSGSDEDKVRTAEDYLKTNFHVIDATAPELIKLEDVLKNKACNELGMLSLTCAVLRDLGIDYQIVVTSDRTRMPFDDVFESYQYLEDVGLFLPSINKYMAPSEPGLRLGYMSSEDMGNHALFIRNFDVGGSLTGVGTVKYIDPLPDSATIHDHYITADLSAGADKCDLTFENRISGYYAYIQCYYSLLDGTKQKEVLDEQVNYLVDGGEVRSLTVENAESRLYGVKPFVVKGEVETRKFSASAGDKMLFKIGELIGPQVQMYADKPRKLPVDDDFNRRFYRNINVVLPQGWMVQNMDELNMDKHLDMGSVRKLSFTSMSHMEGDTLKVEVMEYYRACQIPLEQFDGYRSVVNAAADFNKVALVIVKK